MRPTNASFWLGTDQAQIQQLQARLKVVPMDRTLIPEGGWEIGEKGEETLDKIVPAPRSLEGQGVNPAILSAAGSGDTRPVPRDDTPEGGARNRRIEVVLRADNS